MICKLCEELEVDYIAEEVFDYASGAMFSKNTRAPRKFKCNHGHTWEEMKPFWKFQAVAFLLMAITGVAVLFYNWKLFETWFNFNFFLWNWGSCYFLAAPLEKKFKKSLEKEELWSVFKRWLGGISCLTCIK